MPLDSTVVHTAALLSVAQSVAVPRASSMSRLLTQLAARLRYVPVFIAGKGKRLVSQKEKRVEREREMIKWVMEQTRCQCGSPDLCVCHAGSSADGFGDLRVPNRMQVGVVAIVGHVDGVTAHVEELAVEWLSNIAYELFADWSGPRQVPQQHSFWFRQELTWMMNYFRR